MNSLTDLLFSLGIVPNDISLFELAFMHPSYAHERGLSNLETYDRLEFIGDGVVGLVIADLIYRMYPTLNSGELTKLRSSVVRGSSLALLSQEFDFGSLFFLGRGEELNHGRENPKILEDIFESFLGATYLDQGFEFTYNLVQKIFIPLLENFSIDNLTDYKSKLQEEVQSESRGNVAYEVTAETGPAQNKHFEVEVKFNGIILGRGQGKNKKAAEQEAAKDALRKQVH